MQLPVAHPDCEACELHLTAKSVGIGTEWVEGSLPQHVDHDCVFVVGQNPGFYEDEKNRPFVGPSGDIIRKGYLTGIRLISIKDALGDVIHPARCSTYLTNGVRCHTPNNALPVWTKHCKPCKSHLHADLEALNEMHANAKHRAILCVGGLASSVVLCLLLEAEKKQVTQKACFSRQNETHKYKGVKWNIFHTYHPANVARVPANAKAVHGHLQILHDWFNDEAPQKHPLLLVKPRVPR